MRPGETPDKLDLLHEIDILVDGRYIKDLHDSLLQFRGSSNQRIIDVQKSFVAGEPFAVLLGDDVVYADATKGQQPALRQLIDIYDAYGGSVLGCQQVVPEKVSSYGIVAGKEIAGSKLLKVSDMIEKPELSEAPSNIAVLGRYIISPTIFELLEHTAPGKGGEVQLTDALKQLALVEPVWAYCFEGKRYDVGDKLGFLKATVEFALRRPDLGGPFRSYLEELMKE